MGSSRTIPRDSAEASGTSGLPCPPHLSLHAFEGAFDEFAIEQTLRIDRPRENEPARRHRRETHPAIVGHVADEQNQSVPRRPRGAERFHHQLFADSARAKWRIDSQRAKQQRRPVGAQNWRHPVGADKQGADSRDEGQGVVQLAPFAQPVRRAGEPARPKSALVELFDSREVGWRLWAEREGKIRHRLAIESARAGSPLAAHNVRDSSIYSPREAAVSSGGDVSGDRPLPSRPAHGRAALHSGDENPRQGIHLAEIFAKEARRNSAAFVGFSTARTAPGIHRFGCSGKRSVALGGGFDRVEQSQNLSKQRREIGGSPARPSWGG